jgi:hypothetical protein
MYHMNISPDLLEQLASELKVSPEFLLQALPLIQGLAAYPHSENEFQHAEKFDRQSVAESAYVSGINFYSCCVETKVLLRKMYGVHPNLVDHPDFRRVNTFLNLINENKMSDKILQLMKKESIDILESITRVLEHPLIQFDIMSTIIIEEFQNEWLTFMATLI